MDEVLGTTAGNALEVRESIDMLTGAAREPRLLEVTTALAAVALMQAGLAADEAQARSQVERVLDDGGAALRFGAMVEALGGPADLVESPDAHLPAAAVTRPAAPERPGYVASVDTRAVGLVVTGLGGNRRREDDAIDYAVGLSNVAPIGAQVGPDRPLALVHARGDASAEEAASALLSAVHVSEEPPAERPVVLARIG
jgi:thymidine phosphorylase